MTDRFERVETRSIPELNCEATLYRHVTGAQLMSVVAPDDENKVFGINFRTPPSDSTGIAHILEHCVLAGSEKYPVKEPFLELMKGSLKTFLNAFTYPDKTCYPVASQNLQDFHNLIDVYLDAVFHPRLTPEILMQEGWHHDVDDDGQLIYKGVVFNEMKGAYSSPEGVLSETIQQSLFPGHTYGVDSGGDPTHIPDLTWEQFEAFHRDFYHPSNSLIWFYGDDPVETRFEILEQYLSDYEPAVIDSSIPVQEPWSEARTVEKTYAVSAEDADSGDAKHFVAVNWLLPDGLDHATQVGLQVLEPALLGTSAAPLRKALIDSGLGDDITGNGMVEMRQFYFSAGLRGVKAEDEARVTELVVDSLTDLAQNGIDADSITAAVNTVEFSLRENNSGSFPRGLSLMLRSLKTWLYDGDPFAPLAFEAPLATLKQNLAKGRYFEGLIETYLLNNPHRSTVFVRPDAGKSKADEAAEAERLAATRKRLTDADVERIRTEAEQLRRIQETPDDPADLARIPTLSLSDLDRTIRTIPAHRGDVGGAPILTHDLFTNGIVYLDISFDLRTLPADLLPYVSLFGRCLLEIGTESQDFVQLSQRIGSRTGGLWTSTLVTNHRTENAPVARFFLRGKAMTGQVGDLVDIARDVLLTVALDNRERLLQMVLEEKAGEEAGLIPSGHSVVNLRLKSRLDVASWANEQMEGVSYLFFLRELAQRIETDWAGVLAKLESVRSHLVNRSTLLLNATLPESDYASVEPHLEGLVHSLPEQPAAIGSWSPALEPIDEGLTLPAQVNYVGKGGNIYDLGYQLQGSIGVISKYLRNTHLWERVRVQGGAYGAFCGFDHFSGVFTYASYRDPNLVDTLSAYDASAQFLKQLELSDEELTKAIIGTIGELDAYQMPDAKGYTSLVRDLTGVDNEYRQQMRDAVLATSTADFRAFGDTLAQLSDVGNVVVLGSADAINEANAERDGWLRVVPVL